MFDDTDDDIIVWNNSLETSSPKSEVEDSCAIVDSESYDSDSSDETDDDKCPVESEIEYVENESSEISDDLNYEKKYYKISEVESIIGETQSTIRYWEESFSELGKNFCSQRSRGGTRKFTIENIENLKLLKLLLREQRLTIDGAISKIKNEKRKNAKEKALILLQETKDELNNLIDAYNCILHKNC